MFDISNQVYIQGVLNYNRQHKLPIISVCSIQFGLWRQIDIFLKLLFDIALFVSKLVIMLIDFFQFYSWTLSKVLTHSVPV